MAGTTNRVSEESANEESGRVTRDWQRLRSDGAATAEELRQFLGEMRGKSPQEVLGLVAESGLTRGIVLATLGFLALLVIFTVGPYLYRQGSSAAEEHTAVAAEESRKTSQGESAQEKAGGNQTGGQQKAASQQAVDKSSGGPEKSAGGEPDLSKAGKALGIGETKEADPDENPLDSKVDSLLDDIE